MTRYTARDIAKILASWILYAFGLAISTLAVATGLAIAAFWVYLVYLAFSNGLYAYAYTAIILAIGFICYISGPLVRFGLRGYENFVRSLRGLPLKLPKKKRSRRA
jgi:hypothetical protein